METLTPPFKRLSRPDNPPSFRITDRDLDILRMVARFRFMTSEQIVRCLTLADTTTSRQHVLRRLQLLFEDRGDNADAFWTRCGSAWPHKDGKGLNIQIAPGLAVSGRLVLREYTDDDAKEDEQQPSAKKRK